MKQITNNYKILKEYVAGNKDWTNTALVKVNLKGAILKEINLNRSCLIEVNLFGCNLEKANLQLTEFQKCNLEKSSLKETNFSGSNLSQINLRNAYLEKTNFNRANLKNADLTGSYLYKADFRGACLEGIKLDNAFLAGAIYDNKTVFDSDFTPVNTGMINTDALQHLSSNSLEQKTTYNKDSSDLTYRFYRGIKYELPLGNKKMLVTAQNSLKKIMKYRGQSYT